MSTGDEAYAVGVGLPAAVRLYTAGAVDFLRAHPLVPYSDYNMESDEGPDAERDQELAWAAQSEAPDSAKQAALTAAISRFQAVTALPAGDAATRLLWAEYMLGRAYRLRGLPGDLDRAESHFDRVVALVKAGAEDPMALGNAALGELGGIALARNRLEEAMTLYARQAHSPGARFSLTSLKWTLDRLTRSPEIRGIRADPTVPSSALAELIAKPLPQRLLTAYAIESIGMTCDLDGCSTLEPDAIPDPLGQRILTALETLPSKELVAPDQAAALAYYYGDYEFAQTRRWIQGFTPRRLGRREAGAASRRLAGSGGRLRSRRATLSAGRWRR
jgi:hypothetical protein